MDIENNWDNTGHNERRAANGRRILKMDKVPAAYVPREDAIDAVADIGHFLASAGWDKEEVRRALTLGVSHCMDEWEDNNST